ncbi:MAG TPA: PAS domain S-box protein [Bryobacteraceae bacterium]|nr:PAS domain S-box protein [Bryobacteraceae bacterium]
MVHRSLDGIIQSWNRGAERLYGYAAEEAIGRPYSILIPPDRDGEEDALVERLQRGEPFWHIRTLRVRKGGALTEVVLTVSPVCNEAGEVVGISHISREVGSRAVDERASAFLAAIVTSSGDAIIGKNLDGIVQSWNAGAQRLYGYSAEEMVGKSMTVLLPPDRPEEESDILARIRRGQSIDNLETVRLRRDGRQVHISLTISPIRDQSGTVIGASHIARDITDQVRFEETAARLAAIVESSEDAIISKDLDGTILTWNTGAERVYGYTVAEAEGKSVSMLLPEDRLDEETGILERLKRGERVEHFETVRLRKGGERIDVSLTISPIRDSHGVVRGASHVARDITARKAFEAELRHTQKLESLGVLAGGVAHDFNNLLTGILANASLAAESAEGSGLLQKLLADVVRAAERASGLTRQLLAYAGKGRFVTEAVNLSELVEEIGGLIRTSIPGKVRLRLELARGLAPIQADPGQLQQVIMNLVINAAEALGEAGGTVLVATGSEDLDEAYCRDCLGRPDLPPGAYTTLEVHDDGCGMDQQTLARIFDPFFTTKSAGRGLGLAAVLGIVNGHKGAIKVYSVPGRGTSFRLLFPSVAVAVPEAAARQEPAPEGHGTVLVVDDEESVRTAARNALEHFGYTVLLASSGREALDIVLRRGTAIDVVLLDVSMPEIDGAETLERLLEVKPKIRVLLSSGFNEVEVVRRFSANKLAGFIQKPYTAARLASTVKTVLQQAEATAP